MQDLSESAPSSVSVKQDQSSKTGCPLEAKNRLLNGSLSNIPPCSPFGRIRQPGQNPDDFRGPSRPIAAFSGLLS
jgi:hypothetical protein